MNVIAKTASVISIAALLTRKYTSAGRKQRTSEESLLEAISRNNPQKADTLKKQLADAKQAVAQLHAGKSQNLQSRKLAAAEKIKRIREELQLLMMMGGNPKMIARRIAQLAKELSAAAREYASASAEGALSKENTAGTVSSFDINVMSVSVQSYGAIEPVILAAKAGQGEMTVSGIQDEGGSVTPYEAVSPSLTGEEPGREMKQYRDARQQAMNDYLQKTTAELKQKTMAANADRQFAQEVRVLAARLKELAEKQKERLRHLQDHALQQEINKISRELSEAEKSAAGIIARSTPLTSIRITG
ncbi:MAG TPA: hypothetical protein PKZ12_04485 [Smithellaceae bacterium]|nr:hypothetical protein [Smithellaceae bacterium]